jgi:hypothetical protein
MYCMLESNVGSPSCLQLQTKSKSSRIKSRRKLLSMLQKMIVMS